jgi:hypothetical protein
MHETEMRLGKGAQERFERFESQVRLGVLQTKRRNDKQQRLRTELAYPGRKTGDRPSLHARVGLQYYCDDFLNAVCSVVSSSREGVAVAKVWQG